MYEVTSKWSICASSADSVLEQLIAREGSSFMPRRLWEEGPCFLSGSVCLGLPSRHYSFGASCPREGAARLLPFLKLLEGSGGVATCPPSVGSVELEILFEGWKGIGAVSPISAPAVSSPNI